MPACAATTRPPTFLPGPNSAQAQREAELYSRLAAGEAPGPSFSPEAEAGEAAAKLRAADVVLTTFEVLKQEVHYSPDNKLLGSLRYAKRYHVPVCPLLQVRGWG